MANSFGRRYSTRQTSDGTNIYDLNDGGGSTDGGTMNGSVYTSPETELPSDNVTESWSHGLGREPDVIELILKCDTSEYGYEVGEEVHFTSEHTVNVNATSFWADSTNIYLRYKSDTGVSTFWLVRRDQTGIAVPLTPDNWKIIVKGIVFSGGSTGGGTSETLSVSQDVFSVETNGLAPGPSQEEQDLQELLAADGSWVNISNYPNTINKAGVVAAGDGNLNKVWKTDGSGNPGWGDIPSGGGGGASVITAPEPAPTSASDGDLWFNETVGALFVYVNGTGWVQTGTTTSSDIATAINDERRSYTWVQVAAQQCLVNDKYLSLGGGNGVPNEERFFGGWFTVDFNALATTLPDIVNAKAVSCAVWLNESYLYHYPAGSQGHLVGAVGNNNNAWRYFSIMIDRPATTNNATSVVSSLPAVPGQARFHLNQAPGDDNTYDISAFNIRGYWK